MVQLVETPASSLRSQPDSGLAQLEEVLEQRAASYHDVKASKDELLVDSNTGALIHRPTGREFTLSELALAQLGGKLRVPTAYLLRCPPDLLATNVNHWLGVAGARNFLLRCDGNRVRAVLSERYAPVDNLPLVRSLRRTLGNAPLRFELTEYELNVQFVSGRVRVAAPGDTLNPGVAIRNSEVGLAKVEIRGLIYRAICLNGLILGGSQDTWARRHIGHVDLAASVQRAIDTIQAKADTSIEGFSRTMHIRVPDMARVLARIIERYALSEEEGAALRMAHEQEPGDSLYHAINALTRAGNSAHLPLSSRQRLQELGGSMLESAENGNRWLN
ncbi:MAG: DUF932 domain-containing protein [Planctomycetes bacterium]|nr:DUF932 domain-containing protein [Planctomycetota bacterium]